MTSRLVALRIPALDPGRLAVFWAALLGWERVGTDRVEPADDTGFALYLVRAREAKSTQNTMHLDLTSSDADDQRRTVERARALGAVPADVGQRGDEGHVVLADPVGDEFCVIEPGNRFLADCGFVGALACDGTQAVGYFWSAALGRPLVWDQDRETAIRSPHGGPEITWGGEVPRPGAQRLSFELAADGDPAAEADRLVGLGATRRGGDTFTDPDGHPFHLAGSAR